MEIRMMRSLKPKSRDGTMNLSKRLRGQALGEKKWPQVEYSYERQRDETRMGGWVVQMCEDGICGNTV
jgi:hypothetical protein